MVERILIDDVWPALSLSRTAIELVNASDGVARIRFGNTCAGCPSTLMAVIHGIERELRRRTTEIEYLELLP
jgi:Fe-S cluster biogenesis protein NfuA